MGRWTYEQQEQRSICGVMKQWVSKHNAICLCAIWKTVVQLLTDACARARSSTSHTHLYAHVITLSRTITHLWQSCAHPPYSHSHHHHRFSSFLVFAEIKFNMFRSYFFFSLCYASTICRAYSFFYNSQHAEFAQNFCCPINVHYHAYYGR